MSYSTFLQAQIKNKKARKASKSELIDKVNNVAAGETIVVKGHKQCGDNTFSVLDEAGEKPIDCGCLEDFERVVGTEGLNLKCSPKTTPVPPSLPKPDIPPSTGGTPGDSPPEKPTEAICNSFTKSMYCEASAKTTENCLSKYNKYFGLELANYRPVS